MKFFDISFFCDKGEPPILKADYNNNRTYPVYAQIGDVKIFMHEVDWIRFKNSVLEADQEMSKK